jgi:hypothetical protein
VSLDGSVSKPAMLSNIRDTTDAQLAGMTEAFRKALQDLHACAGLDPKPTLAYEHALDISSHSGKDDERELQALAAQVGSREHHCQTQIHDLA